MEVHTPSSTRAARPLLGRRLATETKQAIKTTEFWAYVAILIGLLIAGLAADGSSDSATTETTADGFGAEKVWLYAVILTVGYMVSRGLAKSGSHDPYTEERDTGEGGESLGDRVKAAAQVLREGEAGTSETATTRRQETPREY